MRAPPDEFDAGALAGVLADGWGFEAERVEYAALGGGSYHWVVSGPGGALGFATVDDLDRKPWLGGTPDAVFDGLERAFDAAFTLREGGLGFVVAPIRAANGNTVLRIGRRYSVALFPFVAGAAGRFGRYEPEERAAVLTMLAELHRATPAVASHARRIELGLPGRRGLESALEEVNGAWSGGPYSEPARQALVAHASEVVELLALADRLSAELAGRSGDWVVTHGEPHAANILRTAEGYVLVDWDTLALAPRERDFWMPVEDAAGAELDQVALDFFRLRWDLADLAAFLTVLRSPHRRTADTAKAYAGVLHCVAIRNRWAALLD